MHNPWRAFKICLIIAHHPSLWRMLCSDCLLCNSHQMVYNTCLIGLNLVHYSNIIVYTTRRVKARVNFTYIVTALINALYRILMILGIIAFQLIMRYYSEKPRLITLFLFPIYLVEYIIYSWRNTSYL